MEKAKQKGVKIHLPVDFLCGDKLDNTATVELRTLKQGIPDGWLGLDAGIETQKISEEAVNRAKIIVWNGP